MSIANRLRGFAGKIGERIHLHSSYVRVFESPDGQVVLKHICKVGHISESTFVKGDPHESALREGERRLALSILKFVNRDHEQLVKQIEKGFEDA